MSSIQRVTLWDDNTNKAFVPDVGADNLVTGQAAVGTSASLVAGARPGRKSITLTPTTSTVFYVGGPGVTSANGLYVAAGGAVTIQTTAAVYAVGASALTVSYIENY